MTDFQIQVGNIVKLAAIVLPKVSNDSDPEIRMLGTMGAIPDTFEWLLTKIAFLEEGDYDGLEEWQTYIINKGEAMVKAMGA